MIATAVIGSTAGNRYAITINRAAQASAPKRNGGDDVVSLDTEWHCAFNAANLSGANSAAAQVAFT